MQTNVKRCVKISPKSVVKFCKQLLKFCFRVKLFRVPYGLKFKKNDLHLQVVHRFREYIGDVSSDDLPSGLC